MTSFFISPRCQWHVDHCTVALGRGIRTELRLLIQSIVSEEDLSETIQKLYLSTEPMLFIGQRKKEGSDPNITGMKVWRELQGDWVDVSIRVLTRSNHNPAFRQNHIHPFIQSHPFNLPTIQKTTEIKSNKKQNKLSKVRQPGNNSKLLNQKWLYPGSRRFFSFSAPQGPVLEIPSHLK